MPSGRACSNRYEIVLAYELEQRGLRVARQAPVSVRYEELVIDGGFRADLIVERKVIVELEIGRAHGACSQEADVDLRSPRRTSFGSEP